jgi:hypothetical protein
MYPQPNSSNFAFLNAPDVHAAQAMGEPTSQQYVPDVP